MVKTPAGQWGQHHIAALMGTNGPNWGLYLNGMAYPTLQMLQKIEVVFGWPVQEQVQLIPYYWDWPVHAGHGRTAGDPTDLRYAIFLQKVIREWTEANPRPDDYNLKNARMHPKLKARQGRVANG
jgi:hypothetical protein